MKYLKTYKLFENNSNEIYIRSENDWNLVNDSTTKITIDYYCDKLHKLPNSLQELNCENNQLTELSLLPNSLQKLFLDNNQLKELPILPDSLQYLFCSINKLTELPKLPNLLQKLDCDNNKIKKLPNLPNSLQYLYCCHNPLEALPQGITKEYLKGNQIYWIKENAYKWIINKPEHYNLLKEYLSEEEKEKLEKEYPEIISQDQFGMFGLKNQS